MAPLLVKDIIVRLYCKSLLRQASSNSYCFYSHIWQGLYTTHYILCTQRWVRLSNNDKGLWRKNDEGLKMNMIHKTNITQKWGLTRGLFINAGGLFKCHEAFYSSLMREGFSLINLSGFLTVWGLVRTTLQIE